MANDTSNPPVAAPDDAACVRAGAGNGVPHPNPKPPAEVTDPGRIRVGAGFGMPPARLR